MRLARIMLLGCLALRAAAGEQQPPPDDAKLREAVKLIKEIYKDKLAKTKPEDKAELAQVMARHADADPGDLVSRFALLREASTLAAQGGDIDRALSIIGALEQQFQIDAAAMKRAALKAASASGIKDADQVKYIAALSTLLDKPSDPTALLAVGKNKCFLKNDWDGGLPMILGGSDAGLKKVAELELTMPTDPVKQTAIGDGWWDLSERESSKPAKLAMQLHAKSWYEKVLPTLTGINKMRVDKRVVALRAQADYEPPLSSDPAVDAALQWLAASQEPDGHWDVKKYGAEQKVDTACTGFALWAFSNAGYSEKSGKYQESIRKALAWLKSKQAANGRVWDTTDAPSHRGEGYPHAIAATAITRAAGMSKNPETIAVAQRALDYSTKVHQSEPGGFRYHPKMEGCLSVSGWYFQQFKAAKGVGLSLDPSSVTRAANFFKSLEHKAGDATTYWYTVKDAHEPHRITMIGITSRTTLGLELGDAEASIENIIKTSGVPKWSANGSGVDLYYWHYGTLAVNQVGGEIASKWRKALRSALIPHQSKKKDTAGSWDPVGAYSTEWGRVGQTALAAIMLANAER